MQLNRPGRPFILVQSCHIPAEVENPRSNIDNSRLPSDIVKIKNDSDLGLISEQDIPWMPVSVNNRGRPLGPSQGIDTLCRLRIAIPYLVADTSASTIEAFGIFIHMPVDPGHVVKTGRMRHRIFKVIQNPVEVRERGTARLELAGGSITSIGPYESEEFINAVTAMNGRRLTSAGSHDLRNGIARLAEFSVNRVFELDPLRVISTRCTPLQKELALIRFDQGLGCSTGTPLVGTNTAYGSNVVSREDLGDFI